MLRIWDYNFKANRVNIEIKCCKTVDLGMIHEREREQERTEDALASRDDEGRGKLRKVAGICKQELIREYPNGATHWIEDPVHHFMMGEPGELKHLSTRRKRKKYRFPK